ncbi:MAG TPA: large conductance mechanosensitive channel protein MscL [Kofleriaceae bacterium]|nr:large conductance mechanosensitive channel protein MscL [Kofleriaceae bacterium]
MAKGFREFLLRGNVVDLAVAVVIGTAFTAVVTAITTALLQPLINVFLGGGVTGGKMHWMGQVFDFGAVINAIITFVTIAAVVYFLVVAPMRRLAPKKEAAPPPETETALLAQIRDLLRQQSPRP